LPKDSYFRTILTLAKESDLFKGDLNTIQHIALHNTLLKEKEDAMEFEKERMKYTILAGNSTLYKALYEDKDIEDDFSEEQVEWISPSSPEEADNFVKMIQGIK
jgi:hypothetical protein